MLNLLNVKTAAATALPVAAGLGLAVAAIVDFERGAVRTPVAPGAAEAGSFAGFDPFGAAHWSASAADSADADNTVLTAVAFGDLDSVLAAREAQSVQAGAEGFDVVQTQAAGAGAGAGTAGTGAAAGAGGASLGVATASPAVTAGVIGGVAATGVAVGTATNDGGGTAPVVVASPSVPSNNAG